MTLSLAVLGIMLFDAPPAGCLAAIESFHRFYNLDQLEGILGLVSSDKTSGEQELAWAERLKQWRQTSGAFVKVKSVGYGLYPRLSFRLDVDVWTISAFEKGVREERFQCSVRPFKSARINNAEIREMTKPQ